MRLDIASLSMAILWNIIFISVVFVMEKKKAYTSRKGIQIILIFYLLGVIRMLFPVDFQPSIGIPISKGVFPVVNNVLGLEEHSFFLECDSDYFNVEIFYGISTNASTVSKMFSDR